MAYFSFIAGSFLTVTGTIITSAIKSTVIIFKIFLYISSVIRKGLYTEVAILFFLYIDKSYSIVADIALTIV